MTPQLHILVVRRWTLDTERIRTSIRAAGLTARITRVDFPAALHAALARGTFDAIVFDPETPSISRELLTTAMREHAVSAPVVALHDGEDLGVQIAELMSARRN